MSAAKHGYDTSCYDLARGFLLDCPVWPNLDAKKQDALADKLAQDIQDCIEDFLKENFTEEERL